MNPERTHTSSAEVQAQLDALEMPVCRCTDTESPCFRAIPAPAAYCVPCEFGWHGPGGQHGYSGTQPYMPSTASARPSAPIPPVSLPTAATSPPLAPCTACGRLTFFGVCDQHPPLPRVVPRDPVLGGAGE